LQSGTSHYFGDGFAKAFDITFSDKNNIKCYPHQTSWGLSTRIIGGVIMTHGDADGLVIPPRIAPVQAVVVPVALHKEGVAEKANELISRLTAAGLRVKGDFSDNSPGRKFAEHEMKGIPLRLEIGPKDIENNSCLTVRRDNGEKRASDLDGIETSIPKLLDEVQTALFEKAKKNLEEHSCTAETPEEISMTVKRGGGFITTAWCGDTKCELSMKEKYGFTARCIPFTAERPRTSCPLCGKPGKTQIVWGVAY
ncbi:MAG: His/Gly/Thr/Pro-type tRNA ligase C-terminal domain-containing protein, partial [Oscillospiraceae bacterium]|nr:His/Gly/Thr/Pro-type tRNA ligase C-terminal domain-containing protein [Oscillospiraceae bacterium]